MNRRTLAKAVALALALVSLTACQPQDTTTTTSPAPAGNTDQNNAPAPAAATTPAPAVTCSAAFENGAHGSGISRSGGTLTATMSLDCDQTPSSFFPVSIDLFYRPATHVSTTTVGDAQFTTYQVQYTTTAPCKPGLWYVGIVYGDAVPVRGPQTTITTCG